MNCKNQYLKIVLSIAGLSAVPIAIFTLTSCDGSNVKSLVEAQPTPAGLYREYLSETRGQKELSFEDLTAYIGKWQTLKDSRPQPCAGTRPIGHIPTYVKSAFCCTIPSVRNFLGWRCRNLAPIKKC